MVDTFCCDNWQLSHIVFKFLSETSNSSHNAWQKQLCFLHGMKCYYYQILTNSSHPEWYTALVAGNPIPDPTFHLENRLLGKIKQNQNINFIVKRFNNNNIIQEQRIWKWCIHVRVSHWKYASLSVTNNQQVQIKEFFRP